jgi:TonB family protein
MSFVIGADGSVGSVAVKDSSIGSKAVETCVTKAVERLIFPKPVGGGVVAVSYPFTFKNE